MAEDTKNDVANDTEYTERAYQTSEVATMLDIAVPTVRKYAQSLESKGYVFIKGQGTGTHQARLFLEKDIMALRFLKEIREKNKITVDRATSIVIERFGKGTIQTVRSNDIPYGEHYGEQYMELKEIIFKLTEQLEKQQKHFDKRLDQQQEYFDKRLLERNQALAQVMNESLEARKQIAATKEENKQKKNFWGRIFNKKK
jgi:predicted transcriptional regulator